MHSGKFVLAQLLDWIHPRQFQRCVSRWGGDDKVRGFSCGDQFLCLAFAQLTCRESLRDSEKRASVRAIRNSITWGCAARSPAPPWPTPTRPATGAFTPTSSTV